VYFLTVIVAVAVVKRYAYGIGGSVTWKKVALPTLTGCSLDGFAQGETGFCLEVFGKLLAVWMRHDAQPTRTAKRI
jgi:hypothetical protein